MKRRPSSPPHPLLCWRGEKQSVYRKIRAKSLWEDMWSWPTYQLYMYVLLARNWLEYKHRTPTNRKTLTHTKNLSILANRTDFSPSLPTFTPPESCPAKARLPHPPCLCKSDSTSRSYLADSRLTHTHTQTNTGSQWPDFHSRRNTIPQAAHHKCLWGRSIDSFSFSPHSGGIQGRTQAQIHTGKKTNGLNTTNQHIPVGRRCGGRLDTCFY